MTSLSVQCKKGHQMSLKMKWYDKVETLFISMASYIEIRNRIRIQIDHYFVYCLTPIVPIVKRKSLGTSDWLKRLRWIRFLTFPNGENLYFIYCRRSLGGHK